MEIGEINGVPVFHTPRPDGPTTAVLMFRVGACDETLPFRGITHLVEHLSLFRFGLRPYGYNGSVELLRTTFVAQGDPDQVRGHLVELTRSLHDPPLERLHVERQILQTEASGRGRGPWEAFTSRRFGPRGPGLSAFEEYGLRWVEADAVQDWASRYFTAGNAVLWVWGAIEGLRLELPPGERHPTPELPPPTSDLPGWFSRNSDGVGLSYVVERSTAAAAAVRHFERSLMNELRYVRGVSYGASVAYTPVTADRAHVLVWTEALAESLGAALEGELAVLDGFAERGPTDSDLQDELASARTAWSRPEADGARLEQAATHALYGRDHDDRWLDELAELRPDDVAMGLRRGLDTAIYLVPRSVDPHPAILERAEPMADDSPAGLAGKRLHPVAARGTAARERLVVSSEGLTLEAPAATYTVRFDDCAAVLAWEGGARGLVGNDGVYVGFDPRDWLRGRDAVRVVDDQGPPPFVPMGPLGDRETGTDRTVRLSNSAIIRALIITLALVAAAMYVAAAKWDMPDNVAVTAFVVAFMGVVALSVLLLALVGRIVADLSLAATRRRARRTRRP